MAASVYGVVEVVGVGVRQRWCCSESSPRSSTHGICPLSRVCGALCGHGECWFPCPGMSPFIWRCTGGAHYHKNGRHPRSGHGWKSFLNRGEHLTNILPLDLHISILTRQPTYSQISVEGTMHHDSQLCCHTPVLKSVEPKPLYVCPGCLITRIATI
jgi:hypothetical protein